MAHTSLTPSSALPFRGRERRQGQALVETVLMLPLFAVAFWGFGTLHERALSDFESTRSLRTLLTFIDKGANPRSAFSPRQQWRLTSLRVDEGAEGLTRMLGSMARQSGMPTPPYLVEVRHASFTIERPGLWPDKLHQGRILVPGAFRSKATLWMTLAAFSGLVTR
ncbi:MAG: hypothetical protein AB7F75_08090 [Planctomycetota bacterium]